MKKRIFSFLLCFSFIFLTSCVTRYLFYSDNTSYQYESTTLIGTRPKTTQDTEEIDLFQTNLCPIRNSESFSNGISFSYYGEGSYLVNGISEKGANYNLYSNKKTLPQGFKAGMTYRLEYKDTSITDKLRVCIYWFDVEGLKEYELLNTSNSSIFTIPNNAVGLIIRLRVISANIMIDNAIVKPEISLVENEISEPGPMITIIDDDGCSKFYTDLLPLCIEKGISISTAVVPLQIEEREKGNTEFWMSWKEIQACQANGIEVLSHTYDHASTDVVETRSIDEIRQTYLYAKDILKEHGIQTNILVYSGNSGSLAKCQSAASDVYDYAVRSGGNVNNYYGYMDPYNIMRYRIQYDYDYDTLKMKKMIDELSANKTGWMVWMIHTSDSKWSKDYVDSISECIDYAKELGIPIVTVDEGAKAYTWK